jgi:filamentous hemagglutinin
VWASADPILGRYLPSAGDSDTSKLPGYGGAYSTFNLNLYAYAHHNPLNYKDPDGNSVFKAASFTYKMIVQGAKAADLVSGIVDDVKTLTSAESSLLEKVAAGVSLATGIDSKDLKNAMKVAEGAKETAQAARKVDNVGEAKGAARSVDELSHAATVADRGDLTAAGRALQKHGGREGSAFPAAKGNPLSVNQQGQHVVDDILTSPGSATATRNHARFGEVTEVRAPDGRGVRYGADGKFIGFLEPNK